MTSVALTLTYHVFINEPVPQHNGLLPNGEPKLFSPQASTLICGNEHAVLTDTPTTVSQAQLLGDWVAAKGRNVTDIFITHGHGDHWFTAAMLAERFGARVVATAGTITQMRGALAGRAAVFDKVYQGIPPTAVTAVTVPDNRLALEGHDLVIHDVGHSDTDHSSVLHVPDLELVVSGDVIYNGAHMWLGESAAAGNFNAWRSAIDQVEALKPKHIVCGHQNHQLDDDAQRTIGETRQYLDDADELLRAEQSSLGFFNAKIDRYPRHLGRTVLWATARALYAEREHPGEDAALIRRTVWL
jgi:glyoxylase-like metal-dependent hydrolase (beta-lactamase superfamily II)